MSRLIDVRACGCGRDDYSSTRQRHWIDHNFSEHVPADTIHAGVPHRYGSTGSAGTMRMSKSTLRRSTASRANAATSASDKLTRSLHHRSTNPSTGLPRLDLGHRAREVSESKAHRARPDHLRHDDDVEPAVLRCRGRLPGAPMPVRGRHSRSTVRENRSSSNGAAARRYPHHEDPHGGPYARPTGP